MNNSLIKALQYIHLDLFCVISVKCFRVFNYEQEFIGHHIPVKLPRFRNDIVIRIQDRDGSLTVDR